MKHFLERLGVCSWSLQPAGPGGLVCDVEAAGLKQVQLDLDTVRAQPGLWQNVKSVCSQRRIQIVSGMFRTIGNDGLPPDENWEENWEIAQATAELAAKLGLHLVSFYAGQIPVEETAPEFEKLSHRLRLVADVFAAQKIDLALETGQESVVTLKNFLPKLGRVNVGVNFDPANMLIYDTGNPTDALAVLSPWLKQCHIKDAIRPARPGTRGREAVVGTGEVNWREFFAILKNVKFTGYLFIERGDGEHRVADIRWAREFVERVLSRESQPSVGFSIQRPD